MMQIKKMFLSAVFSLCAFSAFANGVNINAASADEIAAAMAGVGKTKASAILAYRKTHGPFKAVHELVKVKGIGEKTIAKNKDKLAVK